MSLTVDYVVLLIGRLHRLGAGETKRKLTVPYTRAVLHVNDHLKKLDVIWAAVKVDSVKVAVVKVTVTVKVAATAVMLSLGPRNKPTDLVVAVHVDLEDEGVCLLPRERVAHLGEDCHQIGHVDGTGVALVELVEQVLQVVYLLVIELVLELDELHLVAERLQPLVQRVQRVQEAGVIKQSSGQAVKQSSGQAVKRWPKIASVVQPIGATWYLGEGLSLLRALKLEIEPLVLRRYRHTLCLLLLLRR